MSMWRWLTGSPGKPGAGAGGAAGGGAAGDRFTLAHLQHLHAVMQREKAATPSAASDAVIIDTIKQISELMVYGDKNNDRFFEFFGEKGILRTFVEVFRTRSAGVRVQVIQTVSIILMNITNQRSLFYMLSNNHVNELIASGTRRGAAEPGAAAAPLDSDSDAVADDGREPAAAAAAEAGDASGDEELMAYWISLLKTLSVSATLATIQFFYVQLRPSEPPTLPLYTEAIKHFAHDDSMVRTSVRTITLTLYQVRDPGVRTFLRSGPHAAYPRRFVRHLRHLTAKASVFLVAATRLMQEAQEGEVEAAYRLVPQADGGSGGGGIGVVAGDASATPLLLAGRNEAARGGDAAAAGGAGDAAAAAVRPALDGGGGGAGSVRASRRWRAATEGGLLLSLASAGGDGGATTAADADGEGGGGRGSFASAGAGGQSDARRRAGTADAAGLGAGPAAAPAPSHAAAADSGAGAAAPPAPATTTPPELVERPHWVLAPAASVRKLTSLSIIKRAAIAGATVAGDASKWRAGGGAGTQALFHVIDDSTEGGGEATAPTPLAAAAADVAVAAAAARRRLQWLHEEPLHALQRLAGIPTPTPAPAAAPEPGSEPSGVNTAPPPPWAGVIGNERKHTDALRRTMSRVDDLLLEVSDSVYYLQDIVAIHQREAAADEAAASAASDAGGVGSTRSKAVRSTRAGMAGVAAGEDPSIGPFCRLVVDAIMQQLVQPLIVATLMACAPGYTAAAAAPQPEPAAPAAPALLPPLIAVAPAVADAEPAVEPRVVADPAPSSSEAVAAEGPPAAVPDAAPAAAPAAPDAAASAAPPPPKPAPPVIVDPALAMRVLTMLLRTMTYGPLQRQIITAIVLTPLPLAVQAATRRALLDVLDPAHATACNGSGGDAAAASPLASHFDAHPLTLHHVLLLLTLSIDARLATSALITLNVLSALAAAEGALRPLLVSCGLLPLACDARSHGMHDEAASIASAVTPAHGHTASAFTFAGSIGDSTPALNGLAHEPLEVDAAGVIEAVDAALTPPPVTPRDINCCILVSAMVRLPMPRRTTLRWASALLSKLAFSGRYMPPPPPPAMPAPVLTALSHAGTPARGASSGSMALPTTTTPARGSSSASLGAPAPAAVDTPVRGGMPPPAPPPPLVLTSHNGIASPAGGTAPPSTLGTPSRPPVASMASFIAGGGGGGGTPRSTASGATATPAAAPPVPTAADLHCSLHPVALATLAEAIAALGTHVVHVTATARAHDAANGMSAVLTALEHFGERELRASVFLPEYVAVLYGLATPPPSQSLAAGGAGAPSAAAAAVATPSDSARAVSLPPLHPLAAPGQTVPTGAILPPGVNRVTLALHRNANEALTAQVSRRMDLEVTRLLDDLASLIPTPLLGYVALHSDNPEPWQARMDAAAAAESTATDAVDARRHRAHAAITLRREPGCESHRVLSALTQTMVAADDVSPYTGGVQAAVFQQIAPLLLLARTMLAAAQRVGDIAAFFAAAASPAACVDLDAHLTHCMSANTFPTTVWDNEALSPDPVLRRIAPPLDSIQPGNVFPIRKLTIVPATHYPVPLRLPMPQVGAPSDSGSGDGGAESAGGKAVSPSSIDPLEPLGEHMRDARRLHVICGSSFLVLAEAVASRSTRASTLTTPSLTFAATPPPTGAAAGATPAHAGDAAASDGSVAAPAAIPPPPPFTKARALCVSPLHLTFPQVPPQEPRMVDVRVVARADQPLCVALPAMRGGLADVAASEAAGLRSQINAFTLSLDDADACASLVMHVDAARRRITEAKLDAILALEAVPVAPAAATLE